jgi:uncharacterized protein YbaP (TraB family)
MVLRLICFLFLFDFCGFAQSTVSNHQLLWQISGNGLKKPSYLFGSFHSNDSRVFKLSDSTFTAFYNAEAVVLEANVYQLFTEYDFRSSNSMIKFDANGEPYTSDNKASKTRYGNEDGRPQFLDLFFQQVGYNMNKQFFALETIDEQLEVLESIYDKTPVQQNMQKLKLVQDNLFQAYLRGDIEQIRLIVKSQLDKSGSAYERLIVKRNIQMAKGIDTLMRSKSLFIAVGCAHLAGQEGVINLLKTQGYIMRQVVATFSPGKSETEQKINEFQKFEYQNVEYNFSARFGGKPVLDSLANSFRLVYQEMGQGNAFVIEIEKCINENLDEYISDVIDSPDKAKVKELFLENNLQTYDGLGYEYDFGLVWKRVFIVNGNLVKIMCFGGNKFMNSNRPQTFFNSVKFL